MTPYEVLLSESQERMLLVVRAGGEERVAAAFSRFGLHATIIGRVSDEPMLSVPIARRICSRASAGVLNSNPPCSRTTSKEPAPSTARLPW